MKMAEKELIGKLQELSQIEPRKDWVILTKSRILGQESAGRDRVPISFFSYLKPAFAGLVAVFILFGLFGFSQNSLPGDILYSIKKIVEKSQAVFVSEVNKPQASLELANKRLEELTKIAETNQVKNLAPAINEFQASISEAAKSLSRMEATSSDPVVIKKIVEQTRKLDENKQIMEEVLGVILGGEEFNELQEVSDKLEIKLVKLTILDLETRTLTKEQEEILNQLKELAEQGKYQEFLELLPLINK